MRQQTGLELWRSHESAGVNLTSEALPAFYSLPHRAPHPTGRQTLSNGYKPGPRDTDHRLRRVRVPVEAAAVSTWLGGWWVAGWVAGWLALAAARAAAPIRIEIARLAAPAGTLLVFE